MAEYRLHSLLAGIACVILAIGVLTVGLVIVGTANYCGNEITETIGSFNSKDAAIHAAIPRLAANIARCPDAKIYRIMWEGPGNYQGNYRHSVLYYRSDNRIVYEDDFLSGCSDETFVVEDSAIRSMAENGGTLEDLAQRDQQHK